MLPTLDYLYGLVQGEEHRVDLAEGRHLLVGLEAIGEPDERGFRDGDDHASTASSGRSACATASVSAEVAAAEKADPADPGHVAAPFQGVVTLAVEAGRRGERRATRSRPSRR